MSEGSYKDCPNLLKHGPLEQRVCTMEKRTLEDRHYSEETREIVNGVNKTLAKWGGIVVGVIVVLRLIPLLEKAFGAGGG